LKYYPWQALYEKTLEAPFIPRTGDNFDKKYCEKIDKIGEDTQGRYEKYFREENYKNIFKNFTYVNNNSTSETKENTTDLETITKSDNNSTRIKNSSNLKTNINKNMLNQIMGNKTKVLNFEENIYNYNNYVINNYPNQIASNCSTARPSSNSISKQINVLSSLNKVESSTSVTSKKMSSSSVNNFTTGINNINSININPPRIVIDLNGINKHENLNANHSHNSSSVTNLIQSIKSKQIPVNKDRERRSNSIFGLSVLNNKPSQTNLHKNPTIKNIRAINNDLIATSRDRSESSNRIDAAVNDKKSGKKFHQSWGKF